MTTTTETRVRYGAGVAQSHLPAASTVYTDPTKYDLSNTQYGALYFIRLVALHVGEAVLLLDPAGRSIVPTIDDVIAALPADCRDVHAEGLRDAHDWVLTLPSA